MQSHRVGGMRAAHQPGVPEAISGAKGAIAKPISAKPIKLASGLTFDQSKAAPIMTPILFRRIKPRMLMRVMMTPAKSGRRSDLPSIC